MSKLPLIDAKRFEKLLIKLGFEVVRQKGSHVFYRHPDGRFTTLPHHAGQDIGRSLTRQVLQEIHLTIEEFIIILEEV